MNVRFGGNVTENAQTCYAQCRKSSPTASCPQSCCRRSDVSEASDAPVSERYSTALASYQVLTVVVSPFEIRADRQILASNRRNGALHVVDAKPHTISQKRKV